MASTYIFIADSEFKVFLSELIREQFYPPEAPCHFFTFTPRIQRSWHLHDWDSRTLIPCYLKKSVKKLWGLRKRILRVQDTFAEVCQGADEIVIHTYQIFSERVNYVIKHLQKTFPHATVHVRLIPDGTLNLTRRPMHGWRRLPHLFNHFKWFWYPKINHYSYRGDRLGADADIVDRIYLPEGFPNEYDQNKIHWIKMPKTPAPADGSGQRTALVVGTALTQTRVCSRADMARAARRLRETVDAYQIDKAYYKLHAKEDENHKELWSDGYELLRTDLCIERLIIANHYDLVIGNVSTSMMTSKLMLPEMNVVSCGLDLVEKRARRSHSLHRYREACERIGVQLVPVLTDTPISTAPAHHCPSPAA